MAAQRPATPASPRDDESQVPGRRRPQSSHHPWLAAVTPGQALSGLRTTLGHQGIVTAGMTLTRYAGTLITAGGPCICYHYGFICCPPAPPPPQPPPHPPTS